MSLPDGLADLSSGGETVVGSVSELPLQDLRGRGEAEGPVEKAPLPLAQRQVRSTEPAREQSQKPQPELSEAGQAPETVAEPGSTLLRGVRRRGAEEQGSRGAGEQGSRGAGERGRSLPDGLADLPFGGETVAGSVSELRPADAEAPVKQAPLPLAQHWRISRQSMEKLAAAPQTPGETTEVQQSGLPTLGSLEFGSLPEAQSQGESGETMVQSLQDIRAGVEERPSSLTGDGQPEIVVEPAQKGTGPSLSPLTQRYDEPDRPFAPPPTPQMAKLPLVQPLKEKPGSRGAGEQRVNLPILTGTSIIRPALTLQPDLPVGIRRTVMPRREREGDPFRTVGRELPLAPLPLMMTTDSLERPGRGMETAEGLETGEGVIAQRVLEVGDVASGEGAQAATGELNLEQLARQIYPLVKRLLAVERERRMFR